MTQTPTTDKAGCSVASGYEEIRSRVTYSALLPRLSPETTEQFILTQLDRAGLGHNTFTQEALALIVRSGEGDSYAAPATCAWVRSSRQSAIRPASWTSNRSTMCSSNPTGGKTVTNHFTDSDSVAE